MVKLEEYCEEVLSLVYCLKQKKTTLFKKRGKDPRDCKRAGRSSENRRVHFLDSALCEIGTKSTVIYHIDHSTWFNPWITSIMWIFDLKIWKKALGTQSWGFERSQLFLTTSSDSLGRGRAERNILACFSAVRPLGIQASLPGSSKEVVFYAEGGRQLRSQMASVFTWGAECHGDWKWSLWMDRHKVLCSPAYSSVKCLGTALDHSFLNFFFYVQWCSEMEMGTCVNGKFTNIQIFTSIYTFRWPKKISF